MDRYNLKFHFNRIERLRAARRARIRRLIRRQTLPLQKMLEAAL